MSTFVRVGVIGTGFIARAHLVAHRRLADLDFGARAVVTAVAGLEAVETKQFAEHQAIPFWTTDWSAVMALPDVDVVDVCTPNDLHCAPVLAAVGANKDVICEKPLARDLAEAAVMADAAKARGLRTLCGFAYRFLPAVRAMKNMITDGDLGEIHSFRLAYLQDWGLESRSGWKFDPTRAGSGSVGDLGSHMADLLRFLIGEPAEVSARTASLNPAAKIDDEFVALVTLQSGVHGTLQASRVSPGTKNRLQIEITGTRAAVTWNLERLNELVVQHPRHNCWRLVTNPDDPGAGLWWPPGHALGWESAITNMLLAFFLQRKSSTSDPVVPTFADGVRAAAVCDAILSSSRSGGSVVQIPAVD